MSRLPHPTQPLPLLLPGTLSHAGQPTTLGVLGGGQLGRMFQRIKARLRLLQPRRHPLGLFALRL